MINTLLKKTAETFNKESVSKAPSQPDVAPEPPKATTLEPKPIDQSPQALAERAAEAAGFVVNERYWGTTTKHKPQNKNLRWCLMDNWGWGEPVLFGVNNQDDWNPNEVIYGYYVKANGEGVLQFENRDGIRRNKWRRRP